MNIRNWLEDQRCLFWVLQLGGWAAWGIIGKYGYSVVVLEEVAPDYGYYVALITAIAVVISLGLRLLYRILWHRPVWLQVLGFLGGSFGAGYLWMACRSSIYYRWIEQAKDMEAWAEKIGPQAMEMYEKISYLEGYLSGFTVMLAWSALYFALKYYRIFQEVRESALKSAAMAHEAQLKMLRYQLNPHFLFNTLNAISTLILEQQTELANRMVARLSSFLRYSLDNDPMQKITLKQELAALRLYLDIEKVRFEERLSLEVDVSDEAQHALIPSLLLQPLVENAIKYGIARAEEGGHLRIAARVFAGDLLMELSDDGPGVALVDGKIPHANGVGLRNTRERLHELYGDQHSFRLSQTDPHGLTISIRIPCEKG
ncbi:MAG TPA: histidine kinase [Xanthomonadales bacterium]|nr:histidine kinase [Xanthomonadales bacterium]